MRRRKSGEDIRGSFSMSAGWLFADLLLVLAMLFLAANTMGIHPPPPVVHATPTPTPQKVLAQLEQHDHEFTVYVSRDAFLKNDPAAINSVKRQISGQSFLQGRSAGLIVAYGTASSNCTSEGAYTVSQDVYNVVQHLGQSNPTFSKIVDYSQLCNIRDNVNQITIDIFLFAQIPT
ncbi:MAG TPA: hypothetical protein VGM01_04335 [Ktedonobacteraceae bacterium]